MWTGPGSRLELGHRDGPAHRLGHHTAGMAPGANFKSCSNKRDFLPTRQKEEDFAGMVAGFYPSSSVSGNSPLLESIRIPVRSDMAP